MEKMAKRMYVGEDTKNGKLCYLAVFENQEDADEWLFHEEADFREREILTKTEAIRRWGEKAYEEAFDGEFVLDTWVRDVDPETGVRIPRRQIIEKAHEVDQSEDAEMSM